MDKLYNAKKPRISAMSQKNTARLNEKGFASIVIALIFIVLMALLTVGFAQLARREQQNALNKQLAGQASYAAETGINAAYEDIKSGKITSDGAGGTLQADANNCMPAITTDPTAATYNAGGGTSHPVNANSGVAYSCLLVSLQTPNLVSNNVSPGSGRHMNFGTTDPLSSITIYWGSDTGHNTNFPASVGALPTAAAWSASGYPPVIEFSLTPVGALSSQSDPQQYLVNSTFNIYLYPSAGGSETVTFNPAVQGQKVSGGCNTGDPRDPATEPAAKDFPCKVTINGLNGDNYIVHYLDFYDISNIYVNGKTTSGGGAQFTGEPQIDVTGKARGVLKRLQARLFINGGGGGGPNDNAILPNNAIEAQNLCKRIQAAPAVNEYVDIGSTYDGLSPLCNLSN